MESLGEKKSPNFSFHHGWQQNSCLAPDIRWVSLDVSRMLDWLEAKKDVDEEGR